MGIAGTRASWHQKYESCPFIYVGGLPTAITEGDLLAMFEQYGIVVHINLVRDAETGKSRGFAFLKYRDPRSAVLAVDNFTGTEVGGRTLRVDHAEDYTMPEDGRPGTIDTTPPELKVDSSARMTIVTAEADDTNDVNADGDNDLAAEARREKAVLERLRAMRKKRAREERKQNRRRPDDSEQSRHTNGSDLGDSVEPEASPGSSNSHANHERMHRGVSISRIEKRRRKEEKEQRRTERARIREERRKRRADREEKR